MIYFYNKMLSLKALKPPIQQKNLTFNPAEIKIKPIPFDTDVYLTIGDDDEKETYKSTKNVPDYLKEESNTIKWGQLKLLLTELQFFTYYWDPKTIPTPIVLYIGSAEGTHILCLAKLFPSFTWHLYDKRDFEKDLYTYPNVKIFQRYFEDTDIEIYAKMEGVFFLCDIRNLDYDVNDPNCSNKMEDFVKEDMKLQEKWCIEINPFKALLKFRLPYSTPYTLSFGTTFNYLSGLVFLQPYRSKTSTECRLVPIDNKTTQDWNFTDVESILYYNNKKIREGLKFINPITYEPFMVEHGISDNWDSTCFIIIASNYLKKFGKQVTKEILEIFMLFLIKGANNSRTTLIDKKNNKNRTQEDEEED